jgi:hypothetical protein
MSTARAAACAVVLALGAAASPASAQTHWRQQLLEAAALEGLPPDAEAGAAEVRERITASLRAIWPAFNHRNIGPEAFAYFETTFPIRDDDRRFLAERYISPIVDSRDDGPGGPSLQRP